MKPLIALACITALCAAGCSYKAGTEQEILKVEYRGDIRYTADDISEERAEWNVLEYRLSRTVGEGCERRRTVQDYDTYVPYRLGTECGNLMQGLISTALLPVTVPLFALSGSEARILGDHIKQIGHNLNIFLATPPDDAYLFNTPLEHKPIGEPRESGWAPITTMRNMPLKNTRVEARIDALGFAASGVTDDRGIVSFDVSGITGDIRIPEGANYTEVAVRILVKDVPGTPVIGVTSRIYQKPASP